MFGNVYRGYEYLPAQPEEIRVFCFTTSKLGPAFELPLAGAWIASGWVNGVNDIPVSALMGDKSEVGSVGPGGVGCASISVLDTGFRLDPAPSRDLQLVEEEPFR